MGLVRRTVSSQFSYLVLPYVFSLSCFVFLGCLLKHTLVFLFSILYLEFLFSKYRAYFALNGNICCI